MTIMQRRRGMMPAYHVEPIYFVYDGVMYHDVYGEKGGSGSSFSTDNGELFSSVYNATSTTNRSTVIWYTDLFNVSGYHTLHITADYANNTYYSSEFKAGIGTTYSVSSAISFDASTTDARRSAAATGIELTVDVSAVSGSKRIIISHTTVKGSRNQAGKYTIKRLWID